MHLPIHPLLLRPLLRRSARWTFHPAADWATIRRRVDLISRPAPLPSTVRVTAASLAGIPAEKLTPRDVDESAVLLYLHGGGFATGSSRSHRALAGRLAATCGVLTYVLDYRLAPEHPCPAAFDDVLAAYKALVRKGWPADRILVAGDSAGAALTLMLAIAARDDPDLSLPAALGLICPPVEFDARILAVRATATTDPILTPDLIARFIEAYTTGSTDLSSLALPTRDLTGLPPMIIDAASRDILVDDARSVASRARAAGVRVHYTEHHGQGHVFHVMAGLTAHANRALDALAGHLRGELDRANTDTITPTVR
jgi:epsilon-lactone hydrolase